MKWEYRVHSCPVTEYWGTLEVFGLQGWLLVHKEEQRLGRPAGSTRPAHTMFELTFARQMAPPLMRVPPEKEPA